MCTYVDQRIDLRLHPQVKRDVGMARCAGKIMVIILSGQRRSAFRLQSNPHLAAMCDRKSETSVNNVRISFWRAPDCLQVVSQFLGQRV